jgi:hypothetical protein
MIIPTVLEVTDLVAKGNPGLHGSSGQIGHRQHGICVIFLNLVIICYLCLTNNPCVIPVLITPPAYCGTFKIWGRSSRPTSPSAPETLWFGNALENML